MSDTPYIVNTWNQLHAAVAAKIIPKKHAVAISYTPYSNFNCSGFGVHAWSPFFKTDPSKKNPWYNNYNKSFGSNREIGTAEAKLWMIERGYTGKWLRNAFMDWVPEIVQKTFPIKRRPKP